LGTIRSQFQIHAMGADFSATGRLNDFFPQDLDGEINR
jgi:hypothetical protein